MSDSPKRLLDLTATIVSSHVGHNSTQSEALPNLIQTIYATLQKLGADGQGSEVAPLVPAVAIKKSIFSDHIICLEDGKKLKMLKRHLATAYGMTPNDYRKRWNLPADYPMVAPDYAKHRSELATKIGLGRKPNVQPATKVPTETEPKITQVAAGVRGRRKKAVSD
jgi:predicted transcriptional regulator